MCDSKGVIRKDRENLTSQKAEFATSQDIHTLEEAMHRCRCFYRLIYSRYINSRDAMVMAKIQLFLRWQIQILKLNMI